MLSRRSRKPPCPGTKSLASLTPAPRLIRDSPRSPTTATTGSRSASGTSFSSSTSTPVPHTSKKTAIKPATRPAIPPSTVLPTDGRRYLAPSERAARKVGGRIGDEGGEHSDEYPIAAIVQIAQKDQM